MKRKEAVRLEKVWRDKGYDVVAKLSPLRGRDASPDYEIECTQVKEGRPLYALDERAIEAFVSDNKVAKHDRHNPHPGVTYSAACCCPDCCAQRK